MVPFGVRIGVHKMKLMILNLLSHFVKSPRPMVFVGPGSSSDLARVIVERGSNRVLIVTDRELSSIGLNHSFVLALKKSGCEVFEFSGIEADPTEDQISEGIAFAVNQHCDAIVGFGGGSSMDAAKLIAAGIAHGRSVSELAGTFKLKAKILPMYLIPTTAGTGSEATMAAVVTNPKKQMKYTVADPKLVPLATALDAELMLNLPAEVTAATGIDALTHAIEAYISTRATPEVKTNACLAIKLIFRHLRSACSDGKSMTARESMAIASYHAGLAVADVAVGYVHAIAHQLGGMYHIPHGLANAVVLPHILHFSKSTIVPELVSMARAIGLEQSGSDEEIAGRFIFELERLIEDLGLPNALAEIREDDISLIVERAIDEAFGYSAVPRYMNSMQGYGVVSGMTFTGVAG